MKKWIYVIAPVAMLGIFVLIYVSHSKEAAEKERITAEKLATDKKEKEAAKKLIERQAQLDAKKRAEERVAADKKKELEKIARWEADTQKIKDLLNEQLALAETLTKQSQKLEVEIDQLHKTKEVATREALEMAKTIDLGEEPYSGQLSMQNL